ncbi:hypothetical protein ACGFOM_31490 [Streptomyces sp. NPDC048594]|uniref:hypothetical protein n=1 Tax=Streptomyces sp. NPDC048594 TaxID=3365575 RepID=UPI00371318E0
MASSENGWSSSICRRTPEINPQEGVWSLLKRALADFAAADLAHLTRVIKRKLKKIQYRPHLITGCLPPTGLDLHGLIQTPDITKTDVVNPCSGERIWAADTTPPQRITCRVPQVRRWRTALPQRIHQLANAAHGTDPVVRQRGRGRLRKGNSSSPLPRPVAGPTITNEREDSPCLDAVTALFIARRRQLRLCSDILKIK